ncbi:MAG: branched-chain amino acid ABC transporter substrate-binding protein [Desulfococcaceae bacterium]|jgi:branched-chain amino acid transport system substrate-binding protein|nr:branched-chain amino acid ABC transporter substrate-binding protein [Desulfococcaceae bacterium]
MKDRFCKLLLILSACFFICGCEKKTPEAFECSDPIGCVRIAPGEPIRLGVIQALSGRVAALGNEQLRGLELALSASDDKILGHRVELQIEDSGCTAEGGSVAAMKIAADPKILAIFGTTCSGAAATAAKVMSEAGLLMISGNNSAPYLTSINGKKAPDWQPGYFRTAQNEEYAGKAAAFFAYEKLGVRKAAVVNDGDIYTRGLTEGFHMIFEELGGKIVLDTAVNKGDDNMEPLILAVTANSAQLLFFPLFQPEGNHIVRQISRMAENEKAVRDIILMSNGALIEKTFAADVGEMAKGMYFVGPVRAEENPETRRLTSVYTEQFQESPNTDYYLNAYDAACLLFSAIEKTAVRDAKGNLFIGRGALRNELYSTRSFPGVTAMLSCDSFGDCIVPRFHILRMDEPEKGIKGLRDNVLFTYGPAE